MGSAVTNSGRRRAKHDEQHHSLRSVRRRAHRLGDPSSSFVSCVPRRRSGEGEGRAGGGRPTSTCVVVTKSEGNERLANGCDSKMPWRGGGSVGDVTSIVVSCSVRTKGGGAAAAAARGRLLLVSSDHLPRLRRPFDVSLPSMFFFHRRSFFVTPAAKACKPVLPLCVPFAAPPSSTSERVRWLLARRSQGEETERPRCGKGTALSWLGGGLGISVDDEGMMVA